MYKDEIRAGIGGLPTCILQSPGGAAECHVIPERGGLVSRWRVGTDEVLYLDEASVADRTKNVRGGIPVLFPHSGRLPGDRYVAHGKELSSPQHGFGRKLAWTLVEHGSDGHHAWVVQSLSSSPETLASFPWPFAVTMRVSLAENELTLDTRIENTGTEPMPHVLGFHPYFRVADAAKARVGVRTDAKEALDNTNGQRVQIRQLDFTQREMDLHLIGHSTPGTLVRRGDDPTIALRWSPMFTQLVLWTLQGKDFVCVEPWEAPASAFATKEHLPVLAPRQSIDLVFSIATGVR